MSITRCLCQYCREEISMFALVCPHCRTNFSDKQKFSEVPQEIMDAVDGISRRPGPARPYVRPPPTEEELARAALPQGPAPVDPVELFRAVGTGVALFVGLWLLLGAIGNVFTFILFRSESASTIIGWACGVPSLAIAYRLSMPEILRETQAWRAEAAVPPVTAIPTDSAAPEVPDAAPITVFDYAVHISLIGFRIALFFLPLIYLCVQAGLRGGWVVIGVVVVSVPLAFLSMRWVKIG